MSKLGKLFKVLNGDGTPYHGGNGRWYLPGPDGPGRWMPPIVGTLIPCKAGYHLCREQDLMEWLGPTIYEAEYRGEYLVDDNKVVVREARLLRQLETWNEQTARLFACDCAERVLPIFMEQYPDDRRPQAAIETSRRMAMGQATRKDLAATEAATKDAIKDVFRSAARAVARAAGSAAASAAARDTARNTTWAAAEAAAWATARTVAVATDWVTVWDEAQSIERQWQGKRLMEYLYPKGEI